MFFLAVPNHSHMLFYMKGVIFSFFLSLQSTKTFHPSLSVFAGVILSLCLSAAFRKNGVDDFS